MRGFVTRTPFQEWLHTEFWWESQKKGDYQGDLEVDYIVTCMWHYRRVFGPDIGFIPHLYTRLELYAITQPPLISPQFTNQHTLHTKYHPASCVFTSHSLVTASNNGDSSASALKSSLHSLPYRTDLVALTVFLITHWHDPHRQHNVHSRMLFPLKRVYRAVP
jgi:hypothetical protein